MRTLFLLLLLLNVLFLAWTQWIAPPRPPAGRPTPASAAPPAIRLLREADPGPGSAAYAGERSGAAAEVTCVSAGPFRVREDADRAAAKLEQLGFVSRLRASRDEVRVGLWVRVIGLATAEDVANALAAVRWSGVEDAYVLRDEPPGTNISLGIFNDSRRAGEVAQIARKLGLETETIDRMRAEDVFWLDVDRQANGGLPGLEVLQGEGGAETSLELRSCPAPGTETPVSPPS